MYNPDKSTTGSSASARVAGADGTRNSVRERSTNDLKYEAVVTWFA